MKNSYNFWIAFQNKTNTDFMLYIVIIAFWQYVIIIFYDKLFHFSLRDAIRKVTYFHTPVLLYTSGIDFFIWFLILLTLYHSEDTINNNYWQSVDWEGLVFDTFLFRFINFFANIPKVYSFLSFKLFVDIFFKSQFSSFCKFYCFLFFK
jgi:hypothetical protein